MAINKKLIHFKNKQKFEELANNNQILDTSIVFIQDSKEISTHGTLYKTVNWDILDDYFDLNHGFGVIIDYNYTVPQDNFFSLMDFYGNYLYLRGDLASYEEYINWIKTIKGDTVILNLHTYDYPKVIEIRDVSGEILYNGKVSIGYNLYEVRLSISIFSKKGIRINISNVE